MAKSRPVLLVLGFAGMGSIAATNRPSHIAADEIRTAHLIIVDNHGKVSTETQAVNGKINISRYAEQEFYD
jgi:hypothetical protein